MSESWTKGSIEGQRFPSTLHKEKFEGRSFQNYKEDLGLRAEEIECKDILDLGSGPTGRLERELKDKAFVVSLSPDYRDNEYRGWLKKNKGKVRHAVAGLGQELPFKEESFDTICIYHVFEHVPEEAVEKIVEESIRVSRIGGHVHIMPVAPDEKLKTQLELLAKKLGVKILFEKTDATDSRWQDFSYVQKYSVTLERAILEKVAKRRKQKTAPLGAVF